MTKLREATHQIGQTAANRIEDLRRKYVLEGCRGQTPRITALGELFGDFSREEIIQPKCWCREISPCRSESSLFDLLLEVYPGQRVEIIA